MARSYTPKAPALDLDLARVGVDAQEERGAYKVNKAIVDIGHNSPDSDWVYFRNIRKRTHQIHNQDEEEEEHIVAPDYYLRA